MALNEIETRMNLSSERVCFICENKPALFQVKGRPQDCYCEECAIDNFGSVDYLESIQ